MFDQISDKESYWGEVVSVDDPKKSSRVRVRVVSVYDEIPDEYIPWALARYIDGRAHDLPAIGDVVQVKFLNDDIYFPTWYMIRNEDSKLTEDDYASASVIIEKDLSKYDLDGQLSVRYTKSEGLLLELTRNGNRSNIIIRNDNTVLLNNAKTGRWVHISDSGISIGSETESQQPAVVGDDNLTALIKLNDTIRDLVISMHSNLTTLANAASSNPYTSLLAPPLLAYAAQIKLESEQVWQINNEFFPETKSTIVTLDKT